MTKKDYERAARIVQRERGPRSAACLVSTFVEFFASDNPRFDEARFRAACVPSASVKVRPHKAPPKEAMPRTVWDRVV